MGIFRRLREWKPFRRKEKRGIRTLGESVEEEKRHVTEIATILERSLLPETEYLVHLQEILLAFSENPMVARESNQAAQVILKLFRTTNMPRVKVPCARILLVMHSARNPVVISKLPDVLRQEPNKQIRALFRNINY